MSIPTRQEIIEAMMSSEAFMPSAKYVVTDAEVCSMLDQVDDINHSDSRGISLLMEAVLHRRPAVVQYLINRGANVNHQDARGYTALHLSVHKDMLCVSKMLIENGADVSIKDIGGNTPLHKAPWNISEDHVQYLAQSGANIDAENNVGWTAKFLLRPDLHKLFPDSGD